MESVQFQTMYAKGHHVAEFSERFAARLRQELERSGIKQTHLAERLELDGIEIKTGALSHYFTGRNYPDPDVLAGIAKALGVSTDWLMFLTENKEPVAELVEKLASATGEHEINRLMGQLPKEKQQQVLQFANYLLSQNPAGSVDIAPLPLTETQRNVAKAKKLLELVEKDWGEGARNAVKEVLRSKGIFIDPIP